MLTNVLTASPGCVCVCVCVCVDENELKDCVMVLVDD